MRYLLALALVAAFATTGHADDFDPAGWKLLGKRTIEQADDAGIELRNYDGNLDELRIVVAGGSMRLNGVRVEHTNLAEVRETLDATLGPGRASVAIDLTGNQDTLEHVHLGVRDLDGPVVVRVYGRDRRDPDSSLSSEDVAYVDSEWAPLGQVKLDGSVAGTLALAADKVWPALAFVALDADLDVLAVTFHTSKGDWIPYLTMKFRDGARTVTVDLPSARSITSIDFEYTVIGGADTRVQVFGMPSATRAVESTTTPTIAEATTKAEVWYAAQVADEPVVAPRALTKPRARALAARSDDDTWILLGEDEVDLIDDEIEIDRKNGTWSQVKLVVVGDAVKLRTLDLHLAGKKGKPQREELEQTYGEDDDSVVIDIPGKRRAIEKVRLTYAKHRLDASTRVQVYAR